MCPTFCIVPLADRKQQTINFVAVKTLGLTQTGKEGRATLLIMASQQIHDIVSLASFTGENDRA